MKSGSKTLIHSYANLNVRKQRNKSGTFTIYFDIVKDGRRIREVQKGYTLTGDKREDAKKIDMVKRIAEKRSTEISEQGNGLTNTTKSKADFVKWFEEQAKKRSDKNWVSSAKHFKAFAENKPITFLAINKGVVNDWMRYLQSVVSQNSASTYLDAFKAAIKIAIDEEIIRINPCANKSIKKKRVLRDYLTEEEIRFLMATPIETGCEEIKRAFLFSCFTGLRISDVRKLTWGDIAQSSITIKQKKTEEEVVIELGQRAWEQLGTYPKNADKSKVFLLLGDGWVRRHLKRWIEQAGIKKSITFHNARHTYATYLITKGADLYVVSVLLGHTDIKHTRIYAQIVDQRRKDVAKLIDLI